MVDTLYEVEKVDEATVRKTFINDNGDLTVATTFDPTGALELAARLREEEVNKKAFAQRVAVIPIEVIELIKQTKGIDFFNCTQSEMKEILNDPDFALFRTGGGHV